MEGAAAALPAAAHASAWPADAHGAPGPPVLWLCAGLRASQGRGAQGRNGGVGRYGRRRAGSQPPCTLWRTACAFPGPLSPTATPRWRCRRLRAAEQRRRGAARHRGQHLRPQDCWRCCGGGRQPCGCEGGSRGGGRQRGQPRRQPHELHAVWAAGRAEVGEDGTARLGACTTAVAGIVEGLSCTPGGGGGE